MRIAILSDIHANREAFEACLEDAARHLDHDGDAVVGVRGFPQHGHAAGMELRADAESIDLRALGQLAARHAHWPRNSLVASTSGSPAARIFSAAAATS